MRVLVIGGTGVISTATVRALAQRRDVEVSVYNRGRSGGELPARVKRITGDRKDFAAFEKQMREVGRFDCVIDMICYAPAEAENVVRAFAGRIDQFIFASTVDVYAKQTGATRYPVREDEPQQGLNDYARNKVRCEQILMQAHERGDFKVSVLRPAQTYNDGGALIHPLGWGTGYIDRLRRNLPVIVHGDGTSLWSVAHSDDVGPAFASACGNPKAYGKGYNVAGEQWMSWNQMYQRASELMGWPAPRLVHIPVDALLQLVAEHAWIILQNFQFDNVFDNSAAARDLDYRYTVRFEDGVRRTIGHVVERGQVEPAEAKPWYDKLVSVWDTGLRQMSESMKAT